MIRSQSVVIENISANKATALSPDFEVISFIAIYMVQLLEVYLTIKYLPSQLCS